MLFSCDQAKADIVVIGAPELPRGDGRAQTFAAIAKLQRMRLLSRKNTSYP